jgi:archaetidylinositol phosphate synthase
VANTHPIHLELAADARAGEPSVEFRSPSRIQTNMLARPERAILNHLCRHLPSWVSPDDLTAVGVVGAVVCSLGYIGSNWRPEFLFLASSGLVVNWFGDSLDGSLARHRGIERAHYGYFVDHSVDALSMVFVMLGLGASPYVNMSAALFALTGYMLVGIHVFIKNHVTGQMQLSFLYFGPTEVRLALIVATCIAYFVGPITLRILGHTVELYSLFALGVGVVFVGIFVIDTAKTARFLELKEFQPKTNMRAPSHRDR